MNDHDFARIVHETKAVVLSAVEKNLADRFHHAIDDVVQETYIRAYRGLVAKSFRGDSALSTWLYTIARNESLRMNSRLAREEEKFKRSVDAFVFESQIRADEGDTAPADELKALLAAIGLLPEKYRAVMDLVALGLTEKEIAERLAIKTGTVKSRTSRARRLLKKMRREEQQT
jgi:RNA polymerase sigma-70 factor (ECF subfamily)